MTLVRYLANPTRACVLRKVEEMLEADPECARATIEKDGQETTLSISTWYRTL